MTDWHGLKVSDLKEELKSRGVPLTGLKLKQQLVDKLVELDAESAGSQGLADDGDAPTQQRDEDENNDVPQEPAPAADVQMTERPDDEQQPLKRDDAAPELPATLVAEETQASNVEEAPDPIEVTENSSSKEILRDDPFLPETTPDSPAKQDQDDVSKDMEVLEHVETQNASSQAPVDTSDRTQSPTWRAGTSKSEHDTTTSTRVPTPEILEDQRKRKRRSASPPPNTQDVVRKRPKLGSDDETDAQGESEALKKIQEATRQAELSRQPNDSVEEEVLRPMDASSDVPAMRAAKEVGGLPSASELHATPSKEPHLSSPDTESTRRIAPAKHPVTRSLYIRNFKRPLHIPTLRSHIATLARSSHSEEDQVKLFYLDTIRTHAFISFKSTAAASQVRNALHDTRFPDEAMREPLWIDFIPDEEVQGWIDEESGSGKGGFGGSRMGRKFEIRYEETTDGVRASLHDTASEFNKKPTAPQHWPSRPDRYTTDSIASGVHPDRAAFVAPQAPKQSQPPPRSDAGKGFKALDELFTSTTAKPKLYYKLPDQSVVDTRLDMLNDLRVDHSEMGRSGDEGMKRYTFEEHRGQHAWVDKGPEFGFGRRGQDRLAGFRGRGGGGGGGPRGARRGGGDSWRGR